MGCTTSTPLKRNPPSRYNDAELVRVMAKAAQERYDNASRKTLAVHENFRDATDVRSKNKFKETVRACVIEEADALLDIYWLQCASLHPVSSANYVSAKSALIDLVNSMEHHKNIGGTHQCWLNAGTQLKKTHEEITAFAAIRL